MTKTTKLMLLMLAAIMTASCSNKSAKTVADEELEELTFKNYKFNRTEGMSTVTIEMEYPVSGEPAVVKGIINYLVEATGCDDDAEVKKNGQSIVDNAGEQRMHYLSSLAEEFKDDEYVSELYINETLKKEYENENFVTITDEQEDYTGGVHGMYYNGGRTISKKNGRYFTEDMIMCDEPGFKELLKYGLKTYFCEFTGSNHLSDEELQQELQGSSVDDLPMPACQPFLLKDGVKFIYQPYEISYYAAGAPNFTLSYDDIKPFLTSKGKKFIYGDDDDTNDDNGGDLDDE